MKILLRYKNIINNGDSPFEELIVDPTLVGKPIEVMRKKKVENYSPSGNCPDCEPEVIKTVFDYLGEVDGLPYYRERE